MSTTIRTNNASFHPSAPGSRTKLFHCQTDGRRQKTGGSAGNAELMRNPPGDWNGGFCGKITRLAVSGGQLVETSENLDDSLMVNYVHHTDEWSARPIKRVLPAAPCPRGTPRVDEKPRLNMSAWGTPLGISS
ncbi:conserved hypothetical protein [Coccidioides posadasii str. Silveira]|uniref:Uncharacterized protein n=1 Tax=Coccidioides posadasii (strain RMSCC 757 / Silveira) TaxID=443226 RepID=E9DCU8_COCPS|nr:conserved hypothetical protein [Coccidioides posadasii str. Silveira]